MFAENNGTSPIFVKTNIANWARLGAIHTVSISKNELAEVSRKEPGAKVLAEGQEGALQRLQQRLHAQGRQAGCFPTAITAAPKTDSTHRGRQGERRSELRARCSAVGQVGTAR